MRPGVVGLTCCHAPGLSNKLATFDQRIDYVWTKGLAGPPGTPWGQIGLIGALPSARVTGAFGPVPRGSRDGPPWIGVERASLIPRR